MIVCFVFGRCKGNREWLAYWRYSGSLEDACHWVEEEKDLAIFDELAIVEVGEGGAQRIKIFKVDTPRPRFVLEEA